MELTAQELLNLDARKGLRPTGQRYPTTQQGDGGLSGGPPGAHMRAGTAGVGNAPGHLALIMVAFAEHPTTIDQHYFSVMASALEHVNAALEVFDADQTPFNHEKATRFRDQT